MVKYIGFRNPKGRHGKYPNFVEIKKGNGRGIG